MIGWRRTARVFLVALAATVPVRADLASGAKLGLPESLPVVEPAPLPSASSLDRLLDLAGEAYFGALPAEGVSGGATEGEPSFGTGSVCLITDSHSSLSLFLYGLLSLGVFRSASWAKKVPWGGLIPDWYYNGRPFQIGHSSAIGPDLRVTPVSCFVQPDCMAGDCLPQHYQGTIVSLWRKMQFTPAVLAARGPPRSID